MPEGSPVQPLTTKDLITAVYAAAVRFRAGGVFLFSHGPDTLLKGCLVST